MTPEAGDYLAKARQLLEEARAVFAIHLLEAAGRAAYLAAYHAAQAFIFERTGKIAKTHSGVRSEFSRLAKNEPGIERRFLTFLAQAYTHSRKLLITEWGQVRRCLRKGPLRPSILRPVS